MIQGWYEKLEELLLGNYSLLKNKHARNGYVTCLYVLENCMKPSAYERSRETAEFQKVIRQVIKQINNEKIG